jgi:predicted dehydrogenase
MSEKTIQWGMIGCGDVTEKKSAPSFNKISNSRLVAVASRTPQRAEDYARRHAISSWHRNPSDVITDPEVDAVYIATPPGSHPEYALEVIKAGKPVYIEKPMAKTWDECQVINQSAEKHGVPVFVAYYRRSLGYFRTVKEIVESGRLGKVLHINMQQYFPIRDEDHDRDNPPWRIVPEISGGGYFHDVGCHALDILFYIFGDPVSVTGRKANMSGLYQPEDTVIANLVLPDGLLVSGTWSFVTPIYSTKDRITVTGESGNLDFSIFSFDPIEVTTGDGTEIFSPDTPEHIQMPMIKDIVSQLIGTGSCPSTGQTAAVTSRVMDEILG